MIRTPDRQKILSLVDEAHKNGARLIRCAEVLGLSLRTFRRWRLQVDDRRPQARRPRPANALNEAEQQQILQICNTPENQDRPPAQIIPTLADQGIYIASESTFYRVMRADGQLNHRGRARAPRQKPKPVHCAQAPNQVWVWDITYLKSAVGGMYYYLYIIMDLYSRKIVAYEVWDAENAENSKTLLRRACLAENIAVAPTVVLHGDNGSPLKAKTVLALMHDLGLQASHSRPRVSNDNAFAEALMRTAKYHPSLPPVGFALLDDSREWANHFVNFYNNDHKHSSLKFVTPAQKHAGEDFEILEKRKQVYEDAKSKNPKRWIRGVTRNWEPTLLTHLTPIDDRIIEKCVKKSA